MKGSGVDVGGEEYRGLENVRELLQPTINFTTRYRARPICDIQLYSRGYVKTASHRWEDHEKGSRK